MYGLVIDPVEPQYRIDGKSKLTWQYQTKMLM